MAPFNLETFLKDMNLFQKPDLIVYEAPISLHAEFTDGDGRRIPQSEESLKLPIKLEQAVERYCLPRDIRFEKAHAATVRKHFLGRGNFGSKAATKAAVVERCRLLGYIPKDRVMRNKSDHLTDQCDALAVFDYACATWGKARPRELVMFGETA